ncbi:cation-translocating P-type ATPase [Methanohalobium sp.]|uniref:cation-translocating P-type ATPase n=1 Tax=Methanohalobium sp. TaxID=2837493 RepID=UPI00397A9EFB
MSGDTKWYQLDNDKVFEKLGSGREGLKQEEAEKRLSTDGYNEVKAKKKHSPIYKFLKQFASPLIYILLAAAIITFFLDKLIDTAVILSVVIANSIIGYIQESKAEHALESLSKMLVPEATVLRNGQRNVIPSKELVVGDVVILEAGNRIPADIRLFYVKNLRVDESPLTGESVPVEKKTEVIDDDKIPLGDQKNLSFAGTFVSEGLAHGIVVATGEDTEIGKISESIRESEDISTPLVRKIAKFGIYLSIAIIAVSVFVFFVGILRGFNAVDTFLAAVSLAVAAIPEGLPATITISFAIGIKAMASRNAIIRSLPAVETLGSATVICSDKTGTLTKNQMTVTDIYTATGKNYNVSGTGYSPEGDFILDNETVDPETDPVLLETLKTGFLCNDASFKDGNIVGEPTEGALLISALKAGNFHMPRLDIIPFESEKRIMATLNQDSEENKIIYVKGSPEKIIELSQHKFDGENEVDIDVDALAEIKKSSEEMASKGLRVIGMAYLKVEKDKERIDYSDLSDLVFLGLQGMIDPPREEVKDSIQQCKTAGIRVIMITGDHTLTAYSIARQLGIETEKAIPGNTIDDLTDVQLKETLKTVSVFARTSPEHKSRIVKLLKSDGEIVAVTGDGINDAPALKNSDIGIAMGVSGTEVAREASDMVLVDDNFASIVASVEEGRDVYNKIQKLIIWMLPTNGGQALTVVSAILLGVTLPLLPLHILWINTITTIGLGVTISSEPRAKGLLNKPPRPTDEPILIPFIKKRIGFVSILMVSAAFFLFAVEINTGGELAAARTAALNTIVFIQISYLFNIKSLYDHVFDALLSNRYMLIGIAGVIGLQMLLTYHPFMNLIFDTAPLGLYNWLWIVVMAVLVFFIIEFEKYIYKRLR